MSHDTAGVPAPPPLIFLGGFLVGVALELAVPVDALPTVVRILGAAAGLGLWLWLDGAAMARFKRAGTPAIPFKPSTALVTSGVYRFTRNPMYLGMACAYLGLAFAFDVVWALPILPLVIIAIDRLVIAREEPYLERKFGSAYSDYRGRVRRWL